VLLLGLYLALLITSLEIAASSVDLFGSLIVIGVMSMWLFQILENIGMTIGLMPITGIPLPFMSFGSSFMVTNLAATGMLLSVWARRQASDEGPSSETAGRHTRHHECERTRPVRTGASRSRGGDHRTRRARGARLRRRDRLRPPRRARSCRWRSSRLERASCSSLKSTP